MGWCPEFGSWIHRGCRHSMVAGEHSCTCEACGVECRGKFDACKDVWIAGPVRRAPIAPGIQLPTIGATSSPSVRPAVEPEPVEALDVEARITRLEATVAKMGRDLRSVHKRLREPPELPPSYDERFDQVDRRIDNLALDLGDALRLMQASAPDGRFDELSQRMNDLRVEMRGGLEVLRRTLPVPDDLAGKDEVQALHQRITELGDHVRVLRDLVTGQRTANGPPPPDGSAEAMWPRTRPPAGAAGLPTR